MKRFHDLPYRVKLLMTHLGCVLLTALVIGGVVYASTSSQMGQQGTENLRLLTEQMIFNFTKEVESAERYLYSMSVSTNTPSLMASAGSAMGNRQQNHMALNYTLSKMIDSHAPYDFVVVRLLNGDYASSDTYATGVNYQGQALLSQPENAESTYGASTWARTEDGHLYLIRDVYDTQPLRFVGKICVRIRPNQLVTMSENSLRQGSTVMFFDGNGNLTVSVGEQSPGLEEAVLSMLDQSNEASKTGLSDYTTCVLKRSGWTAVGLTPVSTIKAAQRTVLVTGLLAAALGMTAGLLAAIAVSAQLSSQIRRLADSMNQMETGDLNVAIPVQSKDEIGALTDRFNEMAAEIKKLLHKVVQEENSKRQAQYQNLEYEYRFLQWQVNPHFIYNALETINAMAKLDGNVPLSDMIVLLSDYFRENAAAMRQKFVEVWREFNSLRQYADIYAAIYGSALNVSFQMEPEAEKAYVPTMIIQPLLENALVHGACVTRQTVIQAQAKVADNKLVISIRDNGAGMSRDTIDRILKPEQSSNPGSSLGVRNVLDRMHLLYGDEALMEIDSQPGEGTVVCVWLPLSYEERSKTQLAQFDEHFGA